MARGSRKRLPASAANGIHTHTQRHLPATPPETKVRAHHKVNASRLHDRGIFDRAEALSNLALPGLRVLLLVLSLLPTATGHRDSRVQPRRYCRVHRYKHLPTATKPSQSRPTEPAPSCLGPRGQLDLFGTRPSETEMDLPPPSSSRWLCVL